ncbi:MAG: galactose-1-phosphate uridylyltransferase [Nitrospinae bacterium RIFCSPLOWO2_12_FULL_47_7]|nr:MAG: galactose-1-phosphate uridylyltransferase [Nitrospinae bacterium RIFCSPLOWO2_12_FULL_47_7]
MPELRKDPIVDRWVIISTERGKRPFDFPTTKLMTQKGFCPFCYESESKSPPEILAFRPSGSAPNSPGWELRVVPNKYPALKIEGDIDRVGDGMFDKMNGIGAHEVIIETPNHGMALEDLTPKNIENCFWAFKERITDLKKDARLRYILIFKNHGEAAGATLEHTHCQLIALPIVPELVTQEITAARRHYEYKERCIFCDLIAQERGAKSRIVMENDYFIALCPFAPRFPFETWILPKHHSSKFESNGTSIFPVLAQTLKAVLLKMKSALNAPPYNFVLHSSPVKEDCENYYHWHIEIMPKLTKMAGFEQGTGFYINTTSPEDAAETLRNTKV